MSSAPSALAPARRDPTRPCSWRSVSSSGLVTPAGAREDCKKQSGDDERAKYPGKCHRFFLRLSAFDVAVARNLPLCPAFAGMRLSLVKALTLETNRGNELLVFG